ncbi:MAG: hypothetical protein ABJB69_01320 [Spartobacteria bacterium]
MGRHFFSVSALIALSIFAGSNAFAQGGPRKHAREHAQKFMRRGNDVRRSFEHGPQRALHLSPDERQTFQRNAERWLKMDPQQRNVLRERERVRREQMKNEAEAVLRESGLRLENGARTQFEERYLQERLRIERSIRQETEAKRQQQLPQLKERLKSEFQQHESSPAQTVSPALSVEPKN